MMNPMTILEEIIEDLKRARFTSDAEEKAELLYKLHSKALYLKKLWRDVNENSE